MILCSIYNKTNSNFNQNIKCQEFGSVLESMSRRKQFEKCLTFFNINQMERSFVNYEMIKSSRIEFAFNSEEFRSYIRFNDSIIEKIYLSVHSSQSVFKTGVFQPINIMFDRNTQMINYFEFSKYIVKSL